MFEEFQLLLDQDQTGWNFKADGWPQIRDAVEHSFRASWELMGSTPRCAYTAFQVFGYDFMIDAAYKVWLIEVNAAPCVTERLRPRFAEQLIRLAIDPVFPHTCHPLLAAEDTTEQQDDLDPAPDFELVYRLTD
eukprot:TRINITY_DN9440_c0_g1_i4.p2 TRINITY_DN9440_c0_g1~~TRINITY_DN9440_c0_g1_i4.p2  ORF type:complete len:134 (+),score=33.56 TRINITY_DN9440_c0_g1_i4:153-554(+)